MNVVNRPAAMSRDQFLGWVEHQDEPYEFDGWQPVLVTRSPIGHNQIVINIITALRALLRGGPCRVLGPEAGVATVGNAVRYPDALTTCTRTPDDAYLVEGVVTVFEVVSKSSERIDRIVKPREYRQVPSILRYVIVEQTSIGLTVLSRSTGDAAWTLATLVAGDVLAIPEAGVEVPVDALYEGTDLNAPHDA